MDPSQPSLVSWDLDYFGIPKELKVDPQEDLKIKVDPSQPSLVSWDLDYIGTQKELKVGPKKTCK